MADEIEDDRGRRVSLHAPGLARAIRVLRSISVFVTLMVVGFVGGRVVVPGQGLGFLIPVGIVALIVTVGAYRFLLPRKYPGRLRNGMLRAGRCASCGYSLAGIEPAWDGCRVCPECGAAWKALSGPVDRALR